MFREFGLESHPTPYIQQTYYGPEVRQKQTFN